MSESTLATRCNWCSRPIIFHSLRRTRWHGFLCRLNGLPKTYIKRPLYVRSTDKVAK